MQKRLKKYGEHYKIILLTILVFIIAAFLMFSLHLKKENTLNLSSFSVGLKASETAKKVKNYCKSQTKESSHHISECYAKTFYEITKKTDYQHSFAGLLALIEIDNEAKACHLTAHRIGIAAYEKDSKNWRETLNSINTECGYGGIHGVVEGYIAEGGVLDNSTLSTICGDDPNPACLHAVGHVVLIDQEDDLGNATGLCSVFKKDWQKIQCLNGVFMEHFLPINLIDHGIVPTARMQNIGKYLPEYRDICWAENDLEASSCWQQISHPAVHVYNADAAKFFEFCESAQDKKSAGLCRREGLVELLGSVQFDLNKGKKFCEIPQTDDFEFKEDCYHIISTIAIDNAPSKIMQVIDHCNSLSQKDKGVCFSRVKSSVIRHVGGDEEKVRSFCKDLPDKYKYLCGID